MLTCGHWQSYLWNISNILKLSPFGWDLVLQFQQIWKPFYVGNAHPHNVRGPESTCGPGTRTTSGHRAYEVVRIHCAKFDFIWPSCYGEELKKNYEQDADGHKRQCTKSELFMNCLVLIIIHIHDKNCTRVFRICKLY